MDMRQPGLALERVPDLAAIRPEWARLAQRAGNVFATWEWADAWWRHIIAKRGGELAVAAAKRPSGEVVAILPLAVTQLGPLRVVRFVGAGPSDEVGPVCARENLPEVAPALRRHILDSLRDSGIFLAELLSAESGLSSAIGATVVHRASTPVLPAGGRSFDEFLASRSRNFRSQVRRRERNLSRKYKLTYRLTKEPATLDEDLRTLIRLHAVRWHDDRSRAFRGSRARFHVDFARDALENGWLRLWTMELDGRPAAAWYGLRFAGIESYYQAGRDPAFEDDGVGFVLLCHSIRSAFEDGVTEYRFGLGAEAYKDRFAERDPGLETAAIAAGARGRLVLAGCRRPRGRFALALLRSAVRFPSSLHRASPDFATPTGC